MQHDSILQFFAKYIEKELGIIYSEHNYFQLQNRLEDICKLMSFTNIDDLFKQAQKGIAGQFKQLLLDVATNNETSFFRDPRMFKTIENSILPELISKLPPLQTLNIWSAASSTGQEALSVSMLIKEYSAKNNKNVLYNILGTDISERVLKKAQSGEYTQLEVQRGLPAPLMVKYFKKNDQDQWIAQQDLLKNINFKKQNLKDAFNFGKKFDLVLCRNVLIYQSVEGKIEILNRMTDTLVDGGYLILGSGESLMGLSNNFDHLNLDGTVIYKKKNVFLKVA